MIMEIIEAIQPGRTHAHGNQGMASRAPSTQDRWDLA